MVTTEFVRVKNKKTGSEYTVASTAVQGDIEIVDKPAVHPRTGKILPPKHRPIRRATPPEPEPTPDSGKPETTNKE